MYRYIHGLHPHQHAASHSTNLGELLCERDVPVRRSPTIIENYPTLHPAALEVYLGFPRSKVLTYVLMLLILHLTKLSALIFKVLIVACV